jgi:hypothetical protein
MAQTALRYTVGSALRQVHTLSLNFLRAGLSVDQAEIFTRYIEFWCQRNCKGDWRIEETDKSLLVSFEADRDYILFRISEEYGETEDNWSPCAA